MHDPEFAINHSHIGDGKTWGPALWKTLHYYCLNYSVAPTSDDKKNAKEYLDAMFHEGMRDKCIFCQHHTHEYLKNYPYDLENRVSLTWWSVDFHNHVNKMKGKRTYSHDDFVQEYVIDNIDNHKNNTVQDLMFRFWPQLLLLLFFVMLVCFMVYLIWKNNYPAYVDERKSKPKRVRFAINS